MTHDRIILGVDPGRTHLVTVVYVDELGKKHTWRLSRGQYYTEGMILRENRHQSKRYEPLKDRFASLAADGGSLRASNSTELRQYFKQYAAFAEEWWQLVLRRRESRSKFQRYIGKISVLRGFFAKLQKEASASSCADGPDWLWSTADRGCLRFGGPQHGIMWSR